MSCVSVWRHWYEFDIINRYFQAKIWENVLYWAIYTVCEQLYFSKFIVWTRYTFCPILHGSRIGVTSSLRQWRHKLIFWFLSPISEEIIYIETSRQLVSSNSSRNALLGLTIRVCLIWYDLRVCVTSSIRVWRRKLICSG